MQLPSPGVPAHASNPARRHSALQLAPVCTTASAALRFCQRGDSLLLAWPSSASSTATSALARAARGSVVHLSAACSAVTL